DQVDMIGLEPLQAPLEDARRFVAAARVDLGGEEDAAAAGLHDPPDPGLAAAVPVAVGRVEVANSEVERQVDRRHGGLFLVVRQQPAAAAEGEDRDSLAGMTERAGWKRRLGRAGRGKGARGRGARQGRCLQELTSGKSLWHRSVLPAAIIL